MTHTDRGALRLLPLGEVPHNVVRTYRIAVRARAAVVIVLAGMDLWALGAVASALVTTGSGMAAGIAAWGVLWLSILLLAFGADLRRALDRAAWVVQLTDDGIFVKLRSYKYPATTGAMALFVPYRALRSARRYERLWITDDADGETTRRRQRCAELVLDPALSLDALIAHLAQERAGFAFRPGRISVRTFFRHFPVTVEPGHVVRIEWRARPSLTDLLQHVGAFARIGAPVALTSDLRRHADDDTLRDFARQGDVIALTVAIRQRRGGTLAEARARAERYLADGPGAEAP